VGHDHIVDMQIDDTFLGSEKLVGWEMEDKI